MLRPQLNDLNGLFSVTLPALFSPPLISMWPNAHQPPHSYPSCPLTNSTDHVAKGLIWQFGASGWLIIMTDKLQSKSCSLHCSPPHAMSKLWWNLCAKYNFLRGYPRENKTQFHECVSNLWAYEWRECNRMQCRVWQQHLINASQLCYFQQLLRKEQKFWGFSHGHWLCVHCPQHNTPWLFNFLVVFSAWPLMAAFIFYKTNGLLHYFFPCQYYLLCFLPYL